MKRLAATAALVLLSLPAAALACPSCATRESAGAGIFALIGGMIGVPYVIAAITIRVFRKLGERAVNVTSLAAFGLPHDASVDGWRVDRLMASTTVFVVLMFVATLVWILWAGLRHGEKHQAHYDLGNARKQVTKALALSLVIFAVVDGNLFVNGLNDLDEAFWNFRGAEANPRAVRIQINAHQWAWDARYAGPDGRFGTPDDIITLNDIRVPVGAPVIMQLAARDVLHSFSLPNFRVKQDAVPGTINRLWWQAKETGVFDIACAQHCGVNHYKMRGKLTVLSPEAYAAWAAEASALSREAYDPNDASAHWAWEWDRGTH